MKKWKLVRKFSTYSPAARFLDSLVAQGSSRATLRVKRRKNGYAVEELG